MNEEDRKITFCKELGEALLILKDEEATRLSNFRYKNLNIRWIKDHGKLFVQFNSANFGLKVKENVGVRYIYSKASTNKKTDWEGYGKVVNKKGSLITVQLADSCSNIPRNTITFPFEVYGHQNESIYEKMMKALNEFEKSYSLLNITSLIINGLIDVESDQEFEAIQPTNFRNDGAYIQLTTSQKFAANYALENQFTLIQGPPGTGKTRTAAAIIKLLVQYGEKKVLVCAPSNKAVDNLAEKLLDFGGFDVVRIFADNFSEQDSNVSHISLNVLAEQIGFDENNIDYNELIKRKRNEMLNNDYNTYAKYKARYERRVLEKARVVCCTNISATHGRMVKRCKFDTILIDEAGQANIPEILVPMMIKWRNYMYTNQLILIGDFCQLGPIITSKDNQVKSTLKTSLFEKLIGQSMPFIQLNEQFRMVPSLAEFSSNFFYNGLITSGNINIINNVNASIKWPNKNIPSYFISETGREGILNKSIYNTHQVDVVKNVINLLIKKGCTEEDVGVITFYSAQKNLIIEALNAIGFNDITVDTVDAFQGREMKYIIISTVRSNEDYSLGFLKNYRRLNVAISRAKYGMVMIGNPYLLRIDTFWFNFIKFYEKRDILMTGPIEELKPLYIIDKFEEPEHIIEEDWVNLLNKLPIN